MTNKLKYDLLKTIERIRMECDRLEERVSGIEQREWLTTKEFANQSNLSLKTTSTYCGVSKIHKCRKDDRGYWLIHKSELKKFI